MSTADLLLKRLKEIPKRREIIQEGILKHQEGKKNKNGVCKIKYTILSSFLNYTWLKQKLLHTYMVLNVCKINIYDNYTINGAG